MDIALFPRLALACCLVVLTPGPGVLTVLHIGAKSGRRTGAWFLLGHLVGDLAWAVLAAIALVSVDVLPQGVFVVLALVGAVYLTYLGSAMLCRGSAQAIEVPYIAHPWIHGVLFSVSNPKSYPVTLSLFASVLGEQLVRFRWDATPAALLACCLGFLAGDGVLVLLIGIPGIQSRYRQHEIAIWRVVGILFIGFAVNIVLRMVLPGIAASS